MVDPSGQMVLAELVMGVVMGVVVVMVGSSTSGPPQWLPPCIIEQVPEVVYFHWTLGNVTIRSEAMGQGISSPEFWLDPAVARWRLAVYPQGVVESGPNYLSVFTCLSYAPSHRQMSRIRVSLLANHRGSSLPLVRAMASDHAFTKGECIGWPAFVERTSLYRDYLSWDDSLHFRVQVTQVMHMDSCLHNPEEIHRYECRRTASRLETALKKGLFADCQFNIGALRLQAHKAVLLSRHKQLLERLLRRDKALQKIRTRPESAKKFLSYLYSGRLPPVEKITADLLSLSEVMNVPTLVTLLQEKLMEGLSVTTAAHVLNVAELSGTTEAKEKALLFILANTDEVLSSSGWEKLMDENPVFASDVMYELQRLREGKMGTVVNFEDLGRNYSRHILPINDDVLYAKSTSPPPPPPPQ